MKLGRRYLIAVLAICMLNARAAFGQSLNGDVLRLAPTSVPVTCNTGDLRVDQDNGYVLKLCNTNTWTGIVTALPNTTIGQVLYGSGSSTPAMSPGFFFDSAVTAAGIAGNFTATKFVGNLLGNSTGSLTGTASFASTASFSNTASTSGTAAFAAIAGTSAIATAFAVTPNACAAGVWANAIGASGNLTCAIVSTASSSGTAAFATTASNAGIAAFAGTASVVTAFAATPNACSANQYALGISTTGNLTCAQIGFAQVTSFVTIAKGGTGQTVAAAAFNALSPCNGVAGGMEDYSITAVACINNSVPLTGLPFVSSGGQSPNAWAVLGIAGGGTNNTALSVTAGGMLYTDGTRVLNMGVGSSGNAIRSAGSGTPVWRAIAPTVQKFTSSSGSYTTPANALWIMVEANGGGGGGAGGSNTVSLNGGAGGTGAASTFGTGLLVAGGGLNGAGSAVNGALGGVGGTASIGAALGVAIAGNAGFNAAVGVSLELNPGGAGGASPCFGGGPQEGQSGSGASAGAANSGAGGSGAGGGSVGDSGAGGGSGGCVKAIITSPNATYAYSVGTGGTAGTAGTAGGAGAAGGSGIIVITEFY